MSYYNPYLNAPQPIDPRIQQRAHQQTTQTRQELLMPPEHRGQLNPQAFMPQELHATTQHRQQGLSPVFQQIEQQWTPWLSHGQVHQYQPPNWGVVNMPTSTRGHLSDGAPPRSQGPPVQHEEYKQQENPLLDWGRPVDPRQTNQEFDNRYEITDIWKRAEMVSGSMPKNLTDTGVHLTRGLNTR